MLGGRADEIQMIVREYVLAATLILGLCMLVVFFGAVLLRVKSWGWRNLRRNEWGRAAIGLEIFMLGVTVRAGWAWALLWNYERAGKTYLVGEYWWVDVAAGVLTIVGGLCVVREFAPREWKPLGISPWVLAAIATTVFVVGVHMI